MTAARRVDVEVVKTEPLSRLQWVVASGCDPYASGDVKEQGYAEYLKHHQPYHWRARAENHKQIAQGENYFHATDAVDTVRLFADPATTVTLTVDGETEVLREGYAELLGELERRRNEVEQAHALIDRIGTIVGWGANPAPDDAEDALSSVLILLNRWVLGDAQGGDQ